MRLTIDESKIPEEDKRNSTVLLLLEMLHQQGELIQQLKDEIARLKGHNQRPKIPPSQLEGSKRRKKKRRGKKRPGSKKRHKTAKLEIHDTIMIEPEHIPEGSVFKGYNDFVVQGIKIGANNTRYRLKTYETPDGEYICAKLPQSLKGKHFSPKLISFILYQYYHAHVTQPLLLEQLHEFGIEISKGQLNNLLIENKEDFHQEKNDILAAGLEVSAYINVDDTGARHKGKNGYCTHIGNEVFSYFESTGSKSRINFLRLLRAGRSEFIINRDAIAYMKANRLSKQALKAIRAKVGKKYANDEQWHEFLAQNGIVRPYHQRIATEGALIGSIVEHGISENLVVISDDAGQYHVLKHGLCWIHAERTINKIIPFSDEAEKDLEVIKERIWHLYTGLKRYKKRPTAKKKKQLESEFDALFTTKTHSAILNLALKHIYKNKSALLLVLDRPDIPLHNNIAETAIREYVRKRKISGSTRSETGRQCRDTFTSLKKTCRKLGISFWQYLNDRIMGTAYVPNLSDLIRQQALRPG